MAKSPTMTPRQRNGLRCLTVRHAAANLPLMPQRERYLFVCTNRRADDNSRGCCASKGSEEIQRTLKEELAVRGLNRLKARACSSSCLDQCASGVTILVEPDHFFYGRVKLTDVAEIAQSLAEGTRVERLILSAEDLVGD